jgi:ABC-type Mn2+/Zn2+ transport system permease subunit
MSDSNGIAFHRLQVFVWTLVFWFIFIFALFHRITLMNFDPTQLGLMGISGATYLGFKLQEQPKQPGNGPASS